MVFQRKVKILPILSVYFIMVLYFTILNSVISTLSKFKGLRYILNS